MRRIVFASLFIFASVSVASGQVDASRLLELGADIIRQLPGQKTAPESRRGAPATSDEATEAPTRPVEDAITPRSRLPEALVAEFQLLLRESGHDPGAVDGVEGPRTRAALRAWEREQGLPARGELTRERLSELRRAVEGTTSEPAAAPPPPASTETRLAQTATPQPDCAALALTSVQPSVEISGIVPPEDTVCYSLTVPAGQEVSVRVVHGNNVTFSIPALVDAQTSYRFTPEGAGFTILVGQLMRAIADEPFRIRAEFADPAKKSDTDPQDVAEAQKLLNELGYAAGPVDGKLGPQTRHAIARFQTNAGLVANGRVDEALLSHLRATQAAGDSKQQRTMPTLSTTREEHVDDLTLRTDLSCDNRPPDRDYSVPTTLAQSGTHIERAAVMFSDQDDIILVEQSNSTEDYFAGAGNDIVYIDGSEVAAQIWGQNGGDTFIVCSIGEALTVLELGPHDGATDIVVIESEVFAAPPGANSTISIHGLNSYNDRLILRVPEDIEIRFGNDLGRTVLPITVGAVSVMVYPTLWEDHIDDAITIVKPSGRRVGLPPLGPEMIQTFDRSIVVQEYPATLSESAPSPLPAPLACPRVSEVANRAEPLSVEAGFMFEFVAYGADNEAIAFVGGTAAAHVDGGAGDDSLHVFQPVSGTMIIGGSGADTLYLCEAATDGLSLHVQLGGAHGKDVDPDTVVLGPEMFEGVPHGNRRFIEIHEFLPANDRVVLRLPEGEMVEAGDQETGAVLVRSGSAEIALYRTDDWLSEPFNWNSIIVVAAGHESSEAATVDEPEPLVPTAWRWGEPRTLAGTPVDNLAPDLGCNAVAAPDSDINVSMPLEPVRDGSSHHYDEDGWVFYSHADDVIRLAETRAPMTVVAGRGDDIVELVDIGDGLTVFGGSGADSFIVCSVHGAALWIHVGFPMDRHPDRVVLEPPVFMNVPQSIGRSIYISGFISVNDRIELRVPVELEVKELSPTASRGLTLQVGEAIVEIGDGYIGHGVGTKEDFPFDRRSIVIVPSAPQ